MHGTSASVAMVRQGLRIISTFLSVKYNTDCRCFIDIGQEQQNTGKYSFKGLSNGIVSAVPILNKLKITNVYWMEISGATFIAIRWQMYKILATFRFIPTINTIRNLVSAHNMISAQFHKLMHEYCKCSLIQFRRGTKICFQSHFSVHTSDISSWHPE